MNKKCAEHWRAGFVRPHLQIMDLAYADTVSESQQCLFNQSVFTQSNKHPHHTFTEETKPEDNNNNSTNK